MQIYPAIDLQNGQCVRLYQGDFNQQTLYHKNPITVAKEFIAQGATWLHIIDLDGARCSQQNNSLLIAEIINIGEIQVQMGGGIRSTEQIKKLLDNGASRVIVGSLAVTDPDLVSLWLKTFGPERICLALDIHFDPMQQARVAMNAWQTSSKQTPYELIEYYQAVGLIHILCTDITKDGTLSGPNYALYQSLLSRFPFLQIQASGGIQSLAELQQLRIDGLAGAITGRALYEKQFTLREALTC